MVPNDPKTEVVLPAEVPEDLPLPSDPKVIFLGGLFVLAMLAAAYVASEIVLPLVFAIVLKLLLQPALRARRCCCSLLHSERSSAWARPFQGRPVPGQPSFRRAFLGLRSG